MIPFQAPKLSIGFALRAHHAIRAHRGHLVSTICVNDMWANVSIPAPKNVPSALPYAPVVRFGHVVVHLVSTTCVNGLWENVSIRGPIICPSALPHAPVARFAPLVGVLVSTTCVNGLVIRVSRLAHGFLPRVSTFGKVFPFQAEKFTRRTVRGRLVSTTTCTRRANRAVLGRLVSTTCVDGLVIYHRRPLPWEQFPVPGRQIYPSALPHVRHAHRASCRPSVDFYFFFIMIIIIYPRTITIPDRARRI